MQAQMPTGLSGPSRSATEDTIGAAGPGDFLRAAALTAVAAVVADLAVFFVAAARSDVPGDLGAMFNPVMIVVAAVVGVVVATIGLAVLVRVSSRPTQIFTTAAVVLTLLSLAAPVQALAGAMPGMPAATTATGVSMIAMHLITGGLIAGLLPAPARR